MCAATAAAAVVDMESRIVEQTKDYWIAAASLDERNLLCTSFLCVFAMAVTVRGVRIPFRPMDDDDADDGHREGDGEDGHIPHFLSDTSAAHAERQQQQQ